MAQISSLVAISKRQSKWTLGLIMLGLVVVFWVLSSFLVNNIFQNNVYPKPFLLTYLNTGAFVFYLIPFTFDEAKKKYYRYKHNKINNYNELHEYNENLNESNVHNNDGINNNNDNIDDNDESNGISENADNHNDFEKLSLRETMWLAFLFCTLWFLSNLVTNASLIFTSVSSQTILSSTASFFTLIIGWLFNIEKINFKKIFGLVLSFIGIVLVTNYDFNVQVETENNKIAVIYGNILALLGALCYGVYSILLKLKIKDEKNIDMNIFFGFVGLFSLLLLWLPLVILNYYNVEKLELPPSGKVWEILLINGFITVISDFLWAKAMLLTSPLTVTVGLSLTIPLAMFGDFFVKNEPITFVYLIGALILCISFLVINNDEIVDEVEVFEEEGPE